MDILVLAPVVLIVTFVMGLVFKKVGLPSVIGQLLAGILLGIPFFKDLLFAQESSLVVVDFLAYLGIVFLLFLAGLKINVETIKETSRESFLISLSSALLPFLLGFALMMLVFPEYGLLTALVFGGALMVTSEATKVKVLMDLNSLNTHVGAIMMSAAMIDNIFVIIFLAILAVIGRGGTLLESVLIPLQLVLFVVIAFVFFKLVSRIFRYFQKDRGNPVELFSIVVIFIMVLAALSELLGIGYLIGAIAGGFLLQISLRSVPEERRGDIVKVTELFALGFILPFFFVNIGLNFDFSALYSSVILTVVTIGIAFLGKFLGAIIVKPLSRLTLKQLYYVGWAMNSRGATELVIALAARQLGLIPLDVFSALVAMSLVSTIVFPSILARGLRRNPGLMNVCIREPCEE
jgi:Kef-type K+ transport system membrane component KefB